MIVVTLNRDTEGFSIDVSTTDGTAENPADYTATTATLSFDGTAGETQAFFVPIENDSQSEDDETLLLQMSNLQGSFEVSPPDFSDTAILTITDPPRLSIADVTVDESNEMATVDVVLDKDVIGGFTVLASTLAGTATDPDDYSHAPELLTFAGTAGETQSFTIAITNDFTVEPTESLQLLVASPSNLMVNTTDTAILTINDGDTAQLTIEDVSVNEEGTATISIFLDNPVQDGFTVQVSTSDDTATSPDDYASAADSLIFAAGSVEPQTFSVQIQSDSTVETNERILISMLSVSDALIDINDTAILTILDDDLATLTIGDVIVDEDTGTATIDVTVNNPVQGGFSVVAFTADDTATSPEDYTSVNAPLSFNGSAGESQSFNVSIDPDNVLEPDELVDLFLAGEPSLAIDLSDSATLTIRNDDDATLTVGDITVDEASLEARFIVSLDNPVQGSFSVDIATVDGSAIAGVDYESLTETLTFGGAAAQTSEVVVTLIDDSLVELDEIFALQLSGLSNLAVGLGAAASATIRSEDTARLSISDVATDEETGAATIQVMLDNPVQGGFSVNATTADDSAVSPEDYSAASTTLTFVGTAGEVQSFTLQIESDLIVEANESVSISLTGEVNSQIDVSDTGTLTILDDDGASLTIEDVFVDENAGTATIQVTLDNPVQGGVTITASSSDLTASSPDDYASVNTPLTFVGTVGETRSVTISIVADDMLEFDETVLLSLSGETPESINLSDTATLTIRDDDTAALTVDDVTIDEGGEFATIVVTLDADVQGGFAVDLSIIGGSATLGSDYEANNSRLNFSGIAGETRSIDVLIINDDEPESDETVLFGLSNSSSVQVNTQDRAALTILDNDTSTTTSIRGHVFCDADGDSEEDLGETSIGATLFLDRNGNRQLDDDEEQTVTDESGDYSFNDIPQAVSSWRYQFPMDATPFRPILPFFER